jgi:hypothetical protein
MSQFIPPGACFAKGTYILTQTGNVLIEALRAGDMVATLTGGFAPVTWIGRRKIDFHTLSEAEALANRPVFIPQSSLADQIPCCDLVLSRCHAVLCRGLRPAGDLANGREIYMMNDIDDIIYYHLELDAFDFIVANGLAVESYRDAGNRHWFDNFADWLGEPAGAHPSPPRQDLGVLLEAAASLGRPRAKP